VTGECHGETATAATACHKMASLSILFLEIDGLLVALFPTLQIQNLVA